MSTPGFRVVAAFAAIILIFAIYLITNRTPLFGKKEGFYYNERRHQENDQAYWLVDDVRDCGEFTPCKSNEQKMTQIYF